ncbi:MAG: hypothetical protein ACRDPW_03585 [Mycobacteriales bacterium]
MSLIDRGAPMAGKNVELIALLRQLGWSQAEFTRALSAVLGLGYLARSTVAEWVNQDRVPRDPVPTVAAHVLSDALGRTITLNPALARARPLIRAVATGARRCCWRVAALGNSRGGAVLAHPW